MRSHLELRSFTIKIAHIAVPVFALLAACSASPDTASTPPESAATQTTESQDDTSSAAEEPSSDDSTLATDDRGDLIQTVGEPGGVTDDDGEWTVDFTVTSAAVGECSSPYAEPASNGHYLVLSYDVNTHPGLDTTYGGFSLNPYGFVAFDSDGKRVNDPVGNSSSCLESAERLPLEIGPSESASGKIAFDVPTETGTIVYRPAGAQSGWSWSY